MQAKVTTTHDRITLVVTDGKLPVARVTWGRSGTRVSGYDVWGDAASARRFLSALMQAACRLEGRTFGDHARYMQEMIAAAESRETLLAIFQ